MTASCGRRRTLHLAPGHVALDTRVFQKEARTLVAAGWDVTVIAEHPAPEVVEGISIVPVRRWRNRSDRFLLGPFRLLRSALRHESEVVHLHDFEALPVGVVLALLGRTVVLDSHEDYPRLIADRPWVPSSLRPLAARSVALVERIAVRFFRAVITVEDMGARRFPPAKTDVVRNYVLAREFSVGSPSPDRSGIVYVGDITEARGAREMVAVVERLQLDHDARLALVGRFSPPELEGELAAQPGWAFVDAMGFQGRDVVQAVVGRAAVGLVLWHPTRKHAEGAVPVKLFEYLAAGIPVVASDLPTIRAVLGPSRCGLLVDPTDVAAVTAAVAELLDDPEAAGAMGARGAALVREHYSWEQESITLLRVYEGLRVA